MKSLLNNNKGTSSLNEKDTQIGAEGMASRASTSTNNQSTIATNTSNLHLTRVRVELDSSLQGHLKALSKLTRGIERANYHTELLQSSIDSRRPPRGLIPKVTPRIPDTPGTFTIEWKTHSRRQVWSLLKNSEIIGETDQVDLKKNTPHLKQFKIFNQSRPMEYTRRYTRTNSKRNTTGTQEKEIQTTHPFSNKQQPGQKKHKNHRYKKPNFP